MQVSRVLESVRRIVKILGRLVHRILVSINYPLEGTLNSFLLRRFACLGLFSIGLTKYSVCIKIGLLMRVVSRSLFVAIKLVRVYCMRHFEVIRAVRRLLSGTGEGWFKLESPLGSLNLHRKARCCGRIYVILEVLKYKLRLTYITCINTRQRCSTVNGLWKF